jgi:hypothetical protein
MSLAARSHAFQPERDPRVCPRHLSEGARRTLGTGTGGTFVASELRTDGDTSRFAGALQPLRAPSRLTRGHAGRSIQSLLTEEPPWAVAGLTESAGLSTPASIAEEPGCAPLRGRDGQTLIARLSRGPLAFSHVTPSQGRPMAHGCQGPAVLSRGAIGTRLALGVQADATACLPHFETPQGWLTRFGPQTRTAIGGQSASLARGQQREGFLPTRQVRL